MPYDERKFYPDFQKEFERARAMFHGALRVMTLAALAAGLLTMPRAAAAQKQGQKTFSSAGEATKALITAIKTDDETVLLSILGPEGKEIVNSGDPAEDKDHRQEFVRKYEQMHRLVTEPNGATTLYIGAENWPTPIPLLHKGTQWYFDTAAGKKEILYRRIGKNEMAAIMVCRELVDAQKEYYAQGHDGEAGNQYAQKLASDPGKHNGLYWQASSTSGESPIGPMVASAAAGQSGEAAPFQGYYFRILTSQKTGSYVVDGKMTRGFAIVAYPAEYRSTGVMTFTVDQNGIVYEKNLGPHTEQVAKSLTRYTRDATWKKAD